MKNPSFDYSDWSIRAQLIYKRTYARPLDASNETFEDWDQTVDRTIQHQRWIWERAAGRSLLSQELAELEALRQLSLERKAFLAGRTLWLGGTEISRTREVSQFNCAGTEVETVYDVVDFLWCLLNGAGVGAKPRAGSLNGFAVPIKDIRVIRSAITIAEYDMGYRGHPENREVWDAETGTWTLIIGDSSEAWAKSIGKMLAGKYPAKQLILDFSQIRPQGVRLNNSGWICSGDENISKALVAVAQILSRRAGTLLTKIDIMDLLNWLGTSLSSRRSAQMMLVNYGDAEWREFALAKKDCWSTGNSQRGQSNNSLVFWKRPELAQIREILDLMQDAGGSEPGFLNGEEAERRAPWFRTVNPCAEILLASKSFCNLVEVDLAKFRGDTAGLLEAIRIVSRANYRQTCVNLKDGVLQEAWHLNNQFLRLMGVGLTGVAMRPDLLAYHYKEMQRQTTFAGYSMADELGLPRPKNICTIKPSGTLSKVADTTEGAHKPLGKYIFNRVIFAKEDALVGRLAAAGYEVVPHPLSASEVLVTFPVKFEGVEFERVEINGELVEVNLESAVSQLERYKMLQQNWTHHNTSVTISYDPTEVDAIAHWIYENWDYYVGVSFIYRTDPTKTAQDLGYAYLPQSVVTKRTYDEYAARLQPVALGLIDSITATQDDACATGACPIR
jgi:adenosylcobalamin-dependent ribonucleoside-triphosphate reductase